MTIYHYALIEKTETTHSVAGLESIDMENVDYKRQPDINHVSAAIDKNSGFECGVLRGGMFGLATNQLWIFSAWPDPLLIAKYLNDIDNYPDYRIIENDTVQATVRPTEVEKMGRAGIYVIRWIRILSSDVDEYTALCLETWPAFEASAEARCYGVFRVAEENGVSKLLMLTWYASLQDWEESRCLNPADKAKWGRRSEMELSHWAEAGRLA